MSIDIKNIVRPLLNKYLSTRIVLGIDLLVSVFCSLLSLFLLWFATNRIPYAFDIAPYYLIAVLVLSYLSFSILRTHHIIIRHTTLKELGLFGNAAALKGAGLMILFILFRGAGTVSILLPIADAVLTFVALVALRGCMQVYYEYVRGILKKNVNRYDILIFGIDDMSNALYNSLIDSENYKARGFLVINDDRTYRRIINRSVYNAVTKEDLKNLKTQLNLDGILIPSLDKTQKEHDRLIPMAIEAGLSIWYSPGINEVQAGHVSIDIRKFKIEDLLGREEIKISLDEIKERLKGKTILITGAAGSIGSELTRQIAAMGVGRLILFDNAETPLHNLRLELEDNFKDMNFVPVIGDVRQETRLDYIFRSFHPQIIFHAAAYKHVPLMEENPCEAVLVNSIGSRNVADMAVKYESDMMVMISTDKAVNPTNVMGCSKRIAEIYVQSLGLAIESGKVSAKTHFVTTRFGNVLGSNGSVIPRFKEQIEKGGPVTVTHKDITRFFMTIPEACRLVMEASTLSSGNQIFVFDMGKPVKIDDMARRMIQLSGFVPDQDIQIVYTGLRPGEKLYEEVLAEKENTTATSHERIRIAKVRSYDFDETCHVLEKMERTCLTVEIPELISQMKDLVPEFSEFRSN